jgi:hypothetical protein
VKFVETRGRGEGSANLKYKKCMLPPHQCQGLGSSLQKIKYSSLRLLAKFRIQHEEMVEDFFVIQQQSVLKLKIF